MFITFEGIEGSGKTTQINFLKDFFKEKSIKAVFTKEPGSSKIGGEIRNLLLNKNLNLSPYAELFLILADRSQHVEEIIKPNLSADFLVVSDRYIDSTFAYQGEGRSIGHEEISKIIKKMNLPLPDKTFLLDLPVSEGLKRAKKRAEFDRFESEEIAFHEKVRNAYLKIYEENKNRIIKIDAMKSPNKIFDEIEKNLEIEWFKRKN